MSSVKWSKISQLWLYSNVQGSLRILLSQNVPRLIQNNHFFTHVDNVLKGTKRDATLRTLTY